MANITQRDLGSVRKIYKRGKEAADIHVLFGKHYVNNMEILSKREFANLLHKGLITTADKDNHYKLSQKALELISGGT
jgi:hypothetical protein